MGPGLCRYEIYDWQSLKLHRRSLGLRKIITLNLEENKKFLRIKKNQVEPSRNSVSVLIKIVARPLNQYFYISLKRERNGKKSTTKYPKKFKVGEERIAYSKEPDISDGPPNRTSYSLDKRFPLSLGRPGSRKKSIHYSHRRATSPIRLYLGTRQRACRGFECPL